MTGFGDDPAGVTGQRDLQARQGIDPLKLHTVQLLRMISVLGGIATMKQLAHNRRGRVYVQACMRLAAREQLVTAVGDRYTLTERALEALAVGLERGEQAAA